MKSGKATLVGLLAILFWSGTLVTILVSEST